MYVASKGGEKAIAAAHRRLAEERRGDPSVPALTLTQIAQQLRLAVDRVMAEGSLYDEGLAALAVKQSRGDLIEAIFLLRAYRTTLPRFGASLPLETGTMRIERRISAILKDLPGGQVLGPTFDYSHRLLDFTLAAENGAGVAGADDARADPGAGAAAARAPKAMSYLEAEGLMEAAGGAPRADDGASAGEPHDVTREPLAFPADRPLRLQILARADEGFLLGLAYSTQRGYARTHAFVGELRIGAVPIALEIPELGFAVEIGELTVTECDAVNQFKGSKTEPPQFTRGYGLVFGHGERKALSMALIDRALRRRELGEEGGGHPAEDEEFVLSHGDNIQATGFLEHIKLPHYVDFQAELELVRAMRREIAERRGAGDDAAPGQADRAVLKETTP